MKIREKHLQDLQRLAKRRLDLMRERAKLDRADMPMAATIHLSWPIEGLRLHSLPEDNVAITSHNGGPTTEAVITFMRVFFDQEIARVDAELGEFGLEMAA